MGGRPGEFSPSTKQQALERQGDRCAWCHEMITDYANVAAHHIVSVEAGLAQGMTAAEIRSLGNCAMLHAYNPFENDGPPCHYEAHGDGQFAEFYADPQMFTLNAADMRPLEINTRADEPIGTDSLESPQETAQRIRDCQAERETQERIEREAREKAERETQERMEREAQERAERETQERIEREAQERAERETQERVEREAQERAERETQERIEREAREKAERETQERVEREAQETAERESQEKVARETHDEVAKPVEDLAIDLDVEQLAIESRTQDAELHEMESAEVGIAESAASVGEAGIGAGFWCGFGRGSQH